MFVSTQHDALIGSIVGSGHCVAFVQETATAPHTSLWRRGGLVRGSGCAPGTAIATFDSDGTYGNHTDGSSHAAILIAEDSDGLQVIDQWMGQPVHKRLVRFRGGSGQAANDGDRFHIITA